VQYKAFQTEIVDLKADASGARSFTAYASTFGNTDLGGDIVVKGAFTKTLKARPRRPLLWQHNTSEPIGVEQSLKEDAHGLLGSWRFLDNPTAHKAYDAMKQGAIDKMSIGFIPTNIGFEAGSETRKLLELDLLENSVVTIPMNDAAAITSVKALLGMDFEALTVTELTRVLNLAADAFGVASKQLLAALQSGDRTLTETKRQELQALLGTFPGLDAVRTDVQSLLQTASAPPLPPESVPSTGLAAHRALRFEIAERLKVASRREV